MLCSGAPCKDTLLTKFALRNACDWIQPCMDLCALRAPQPCDCYSTRLHTPAPQQGLFWVLPRTAWLAQLLRWHLGSLPRFTPTPWWFVSAPKLWTSMMFFMQGEERGKRPLSLFPLLYQTLAVKTPVENTGKWKDFYNTNELSIRPKEQGYVVVCLFQFSNVHRDRLSNPVIHIK